MVIFPIFRAPKRLIGRGKFAKNAILKDPDFRERCHAREFPPENPQSYAGLSFETSAQEGMQTDGRARESGVCPYDRYTMSNIKARSPTELRAILQYRGFFLDVKISGRPPASSRRRPMIRLALRPYDHLRHKGDQLRLTVMSSWTRM